MELHRLKPMEKGYDSQLFNKLYKETTQLRKSLARQIDSRRYGVTDDVVLSWFDDKFMFVFNKHFKDKEEDVLRGFIINSLQTFKFRVLRKAYSQQAEFYTSTVDLDGERDLINIIPVSNELNSEELFLEMAKTFMKEKLSDDAYFLFNLELNPPPYILNQLKDCSTKIASKLFAEYLGLGNSNKALKYINSLRSEIRETTKMAREHFSNLAISN